MKTRILSLAIASLAICACSPKVVTNILVERDPLPENTPVALLNENEPAPAAGEKLGSVEIGDTGFTTYKNATWEIVTDIAKKEARQAGGNTVKITRHRPPSFQCTIHRIDADIFFVGDVPSILPKVLVDTTLAVQAFSDTLNVAHTTGNSAPSSVKPEVSYATAHQNNYQVVRVNASKEQYENKKGFRVSAGGGWGRRLGKVPSGYDKILTQYYKDLRNGYSAGGDITYFFSNIAGLGQGVGFKFSRFHSDGSVGVTVQYENGTEATGIMRDNLDIDYYGIMYSARQVSENKKTVLWCNVGLGMANFSDKGSVIDDHLKETGLTAIYNVDLGYDIKLLGNLYLGAAASLYLGSMSAATIKNLDTGETQTVVLVGDLTESLAQFALTAGLKYHF